MSVRVMMKRVLSVRASMHLSVPQSVNPSVRPSYRSQSVYDEDSPIKENYTGSSNPGLCL